MQTHMGRRGSPALFKSQPEDAITTTSEHLNQHLPDHLSHTCILAHQISQLQAESSACEMQVLIKTADAAADADTMANGGSMQQDVIVAARSELYRSLRLGMYGSGSDQGPASGVPQVATY